MIAETDAPGSESRDDINRSDVTDRITVNTTATRSLCRPHFTHFCYALHRRIIRGNSDCYSGWVVSAFFVSPGSVPIIK